MSALYELRGLSVRFGSAEVLRSVSLDLSAGEFVAIGGPNGAGKSTLLSVLAALRAPSSGSCSYAGREIGDWPRREFARRVGVVLQAERGSFPFTVEDVVYMGRMPHRSGWNESAEDHATVERALAATETTTFRGREFRTLSGGEQQRVLVASALAQAGGVLLDEPSAYLDLRHQVTLYRLFRELSRQGLLVVAVTHDLNLAAAYADRLILLRAGEVFADSVPSEVLEAPRLAELFEIGVEVHHNAAGRPWLVYGE